MRAEKSKAGVMPDARQEHGAERDDPVRSALIAALQRRSGNYDGEVGALLQARIAELAQRHSAPVDTTPPDDIDATVPPDHSPSRLGQLLEYMTATKPAAASATSRGTGNNTASLQSSPSAMLDEFRQLWSRIRTDTQLRQALAAVPEDAGPLHSSTLLHRAMSLMRDASPGYLQHFIAYADALSWMEQLHATGALETATGAAASAPRSSTRTRSRKRN